MHCSKNGLTHIKVICTDRCCAPRSASGGPDDKADPGKVRSSRCGLRRLPSSLKACGPGAQAIDNMLRCLGGMLQVSFAVFCWLMQANAAANLGYSKYP
jgi:hypothetical protein